MKIGIIGLGNLGIPFALLCQEAGLSVTVSDKDEDLISNLSQNICLTKEPNVQKMLFEQEGILISDPLEIIKNCDIIFTFVDTSQFLEGNIDTSEIFEVSNLFFTASQLEIPIYEKKFVIGSTTNVGDTEQIQNKLEMFNIQVAYHPFFYENGSIINDLKNLDTILIGTIHQEISNQIISIHQKIRTKPTNAFFMSMKSAEIVKLSISSFISMKKSFANIIGDLMVKSNLEKEIDLVLNAIGNDRRIGVDGLKYDFGVGGPSLSRDNKAFAYFLKKTNDNIDLISKVDEYNQLHLEFIKQKYVALNPEKEIPFVLDGLSHPKNSDNLENSPKYKLCIDLLDEGYTLNVIEDSNISSKLNSVCKSFDGRLKFFKLGTKPEGILIDL
jgi:nucleotide sugar dehydrogenase